MLNAMKIGFSLKIQYFVVKTYFKAETRRHTAQTVKVLHKYSLENYYKTIIMQ